jgi:bifunctional DNA-binding transcriptional regulator/antitoxin component of YhaV-PrlF toxin-antitoxin module
MKSLVVSEKIKVWERGQITIPVKLRKQLKIEENSVIYAEPLGKGIYLRPKESVLLEVQKEGEKLMQKKGLKIKDLLNEKS